MEDRSDKNEPDEAAPAATTAEIASGDEIAIAAAAALADEDESDDRPGVVAGWSFLVVLFAIFLALVFWANNRSDSPSVVASTTSTTEQAQVDLPSTVVEFSVTEDGLVTLSGAVPDEGARRQLIEAATAIYGDGKVTDSLVVDDGVTLAGGTMNTTGIAPHDDESIGSLVTAAKQLGLVEGTLGAVFSDQVLSSVSAEVALATNSATLTGAFPDQASIDLFRSSAVDVFGADNVESAGAFVDSSTTLQGATLLVSGLLDAGDSRGQTLISGLADSFTSATIDASALAVDASPEALGRLEAKLRAAVQLNPILFGSGSTEIDAVSDAILEQIAAAVIAAPGIPVEIVGHTDDQGGEELNQELSQGRALAVVARLEELGVEPIRLTARGAGEGEPIADNTTEEGRAANRRIAFEFEGAAG